MFVFFLFFFFPSRNPPKVDYVKWKSNNFTAKKVVGDLKEEERGRTIGGKKGRSAIAKFVKAQSRLVSRNRLWRKSRRRYNFFLFKCRFTQNKKIFVFFCFFFLYSIFFSCAFPHGFTRFRRSFFFLFFFKSASNLFA